MSTPRKKSYRNLIISGIIIAIFAFLMMFGLKHNANFTPSQLVGKAAPSFSASLSTGGNFDFNATYNKDRWVVINFWSSSCYVCREEAHDLQDFYQTVSLTQKNNPQFLSINIQDDRSSILQWQKDFSQTFPVIEDQKGLLSLNYGVTGTPETFFIDPNNLVRYRVAGAVNKKIILNFIEWMNKNPMASEEAAAQSLNKITSGS